MAAIDYERAACEAIGLKHRADDYGNETYHFLGEFEIGGSAETIKAITEYHLKYVAQTINETTAELDKELGESSNKHKDWWRNHGFLTFGKYQYAIKHIASLRKAWDSENTESPDHHTCELIELYDLEKHTDNAQGYANYLKAVEPRLGRFLSHKVDAVLPESDRLMHSYIIGRNGSGKTTLLKTLIHSYVTQSNLGGVVVLDPHGDMAEEITRWQEFVDNDRLVFIDPALSTNHTPRLNPLELPSGVDADTYAQEIVEVFADMLRGEGGTDITNNMHTLLKPCIAVLLETGNTTFRDLRHFMQTNQRAQKWIAKGKQSRNTERREFFIDEFEDKSFEITKKSIVRKIRSITNSEVEQQFFLGKSTFDLEGLLDAGKVVVFNLSKGVIGEAASEAIGRFVLGRLHGMALRRQKNRKSSRVPVHVFVDECQNFVGKRIGHILAEDRKYGVHLTLANQYRRQIDKIEIREAILRNTHVKMVGLSSDDNIIAKEMGVTGQDFLNLEQGQFYCKSGTSPSIKINVRGDLADARNNMTEKQWKAMAADQLTKYYRSINSHDNEGISLSVGTPAPLE